MVYSLLSHNLEKEKTNFLWARPFPCILTTALQDGRYYYFSFMDEGGEGNKGLGNFPKVTELAGDEARFRPRPACSPAMLDPGNCAWGRQMVFSKDGCHRSPTPHALLLM